MTLARIHPVLSLISGSMYAAAARGEMHITSGAKRLGLVLVVPSISYSIFYYPGALLALH